MKLKCWYINYLLIICLFELSILCISLNETNIEDNITQFSIYSPVNFKIQVQTLFYTVHAPLFINGDAEFRLQAQANGWIGNGTFSNPYLIKNYNITSTDTNASAISIQFTTVFFSIYNCYLSSNGYSNSISLNTVKNGLITSNNIITNLSFTNKIGVYAINSSNINITSNTISNYIYGIGITHSNSITISNNLLTTNLDGISITYSNNSFISNNQIFSSKAVGVNAYSVYNSTFINNTLKYNNIGFYFFNATTNKVENNIISVNAFGINLDYSSNTIIISNFLSNNSNYGVQLFNSTDNKIYYNYFLFNNAFMLSQAYCDTNTNNWDDGEFGNYWSNYNITNSSNKNIGILPYNIAGGAHASDLYPLLHADSGYILTSESVVNYQANSQIPALNWIIVSLQPVHLSIQRNGIEVINTSERFGFLVQYYPESLSVGTYNYTIVVTINGHKQTNTIMVHVYSCNLLVCNNVVLPFINTPYLFLGSLIIVLLSLVIFLLRKYWLEVLGIFISILKVLYIPNRKLDKIQVVVHTKRRKIIDFLELQAEKGETLLNLMEKMHISKQLLLWHLKILEDFSIIEIFKVKRELVIVLQEYSDRFDPRLKEFELSFNSPQGQAFRDFLLNLSDGQTFSIDDVILQTRWNKRTAQRRIKHLEVLQVLLKDDSSNLYKINGQNSLITKSNKNSE